MSEPTVTDAVGNPIFAAGGFPVVLPPEINLSVRLVHDDVPGNAIWMTDANGVPGWHVPPELALKEKQSSPAFVWILREEYHYEGSVVMGVFLTKEDAREESLRIEKDRPHSRPHQIWQIDDRGDESRDFDRGVTHHLERYDLQGVVPTDLLAFALSILQGDPVACDAVRDILKL